LLWHGESLVAFKVCVEGIGGASGRLSRFYLKDTRKEQQMDEQLKQSALDFHEFPHPGKIQVSPTKPLATQRDLALAYSPGVAAPCLEIEKDPLAAYKYTARGLVAVVSNGTAVLGLGNIGAWPVSR
jgi:malic enzyme